MIITNILNPGVHYIEPVAHPEFLCHMVYQNGRTVPSPKQSEKLIDDLLIMSYGTNIKARRAQLRLAHDIHKLGPIVIDERLQFVLFPITVCRRGNPFWINLHHLLEFAKAPDNTTLIRFNDGAETRTTTDYATCERQYGKALKVMDRSLKIKAQSAMYLTHNTTYTGQTDYRFNR